MRLKSGKISIVLSKLCLDGDLDLLSLGNEFSSEILIEVKACLSDKYVSKHIEALSWIDLLFFISNASPEVSDTPLNESSLLSGNINISNNMHSLINEVKGDKSE